MRHGRHWPREEQHANAFEEFGDLSPADLSDAARVAAAWAPLRRDFVPPVEPYRPEYDHTVRSI